MRTGVRHATSWLTACALIAAGSRAGDGSKKTWDFEGDAPRAIARGFSAEVAGNHVLFQGAKSDDDTFNVALVRDTSAQTYFDDLTVSE